MSMSPSSSVPQIRLLPESGVEGPAFKKQRIEVDNGLNTRLSVETAVRIEVHEDSPRVDGPSSVGGANSISKTKKLKKKKKDPPLPEPCSAADVLYQEIRTLLSEAVVDRITEAGGAFKSPYAYGEEITVKVEVFGSGGASFLSLKLPCLIVELIRFWNCRWRRRQRPMGDRCPFRAHGRNCAS